MTFRRRYLRRLQRAAGEGEGESARDASLIEDDQVQGLPPKTDIAPQPRRGQDRQLATLPNQTLQTPISVELPTSAPPEAPNALASVSSTYVSDDKGRLRKY